MACTPYLRLNTQDFEQCLADACVFRLIEERRVTVIIVVVHVNDVFSSELKSR